ncbi:MAG: prolipoprotein diacylglyceryl transferase [Clostridia bacterium]|nr:prolipoprotein diacylglyceryl transferase [Clostridia bacterium]
MNTGLYLYYASFLVGYLAAFFVNLKTYYKYRTTATRVWMYSLTFVYGFAGAFAAGRVYNVVYHRLGFAGDATFAMFGAVILVPVMEIATVLTEKAVRKAVNKKRAQTQIKAPLPAVSVRDTVDMLAPNIFIVLGFGKLGCHLNGCCFGIECGFGIEHTVNGAAVRTFPVQIFEACLIFGMLIAVYFLKKRPFYRRGMAYPLTAACYCAIRFGVEFLRWYEPEMRRAVLGMTLWQCASVIVFVSSVISLIVLYKTGESSPLPGKNKPAEDPELTIEEE